MTLEKLYTLEDVVLEALEATNGGTTVEVTKWLQFNRRNVLDENALTIEEEGLGNIIRRIRKKRPPYEASASAHQLCLDLGLPDLDLDTEISVPIDTKDLLYGKCEWREWDDATIDDLDLDILRREAQRSALDQTITNHKLVRQVAARIVPGRTDIPLRELRQLAKARKQ